jgi:3-(3-hydroxy-phenyl)propionate hydroxylase
MSKLIADSLQKGKVMKQELQRDAIPDARQRAKVRVAIVGAGPVGLTLGLGLARYGLPSLILDDDDKLSEGSRAICVQRHTLEIFDRLGIVAPMMAKGVTWTLGRVFFGERELFQIKFPGGSAEKFPPFINLQQFYTEQILVDALAEQSLCDLRWKHKVTGLKQTAEHVELTVETPDGTKIVEAEYVLAADGARSPVRHMLDVEFVGKTYHDRFLIADIRAKLDFPKERWFWFDPIFNRGKSALLHPQPDNVWRIDWQLGADIDIEAEKQPEKLDKRIKEVIGERKYELVWASIYTFHQRHAARFRVGRVFLLGDAAHLMSPFGARGMNSGVQDAANMLWKLQLVLTDRAPDSLLDTYETERKAAALENLHITDRSMAFITPHGKGRLWLRNRILQGSVRVQKLRKLVNSGRLSFPFRYCESEIVCRENQLPSPANVRQLPAFIRNWRTFRKAPRAGLLAPDAFYTANGESKRLCELFGRDFVVLFFAPNAHKAAAQLQTVIRDLPDLPVKIYAVVAQNPGGFRLPLFTPLWDANGTLARTYAAQPGTLYLVRPDGHIAARGWAFPLPELPEKLRLAAGFKRRAKSSQLRAESGGK